MTILATASKKDRIAILSAYKSMMRACHDTTTKAERKEIRRAFEYSLNAHEGARRKSGEPYILHPIAVAKIVVKEIGLDATSVICALLHDVVEDTFAEISDMKREFGSEVARIIDGLTKISGVFDHKSSAQAENFRKMLLTLSDDIRVILIKLADRLHNMRTLQHMKKESQLKIASETLYLYAPLANRLGLNAIKTELEDHSMKYTQPSVYIELNAKLKKTQRESRYYIQSFMRSIREKLKASGLNFEIKSRFKSVYSIYSKMLRQGIPFEEVYDLFAIRIILETDLEIEKSDCWKVYSLVTELYKPNPERTRDWITLPKSNAYESLHVTVMGPKGKWVEVQIRSRRMDYIAEYGMASHWSYKGVKRNTEMEFEDWLNQIRELLENPSMNAIDVVKEFKSNLVTDEVFVFTPKGDIKKLPKNSSVLDFAYEIHTKIGEQCIGAKVNNKVVPLSHKLNNGDQTEIITSKKQSPKEDWLQYAKTSKARNRIEESIRKQARVLANKGRELYLWKARKHGMEKDQNLIKELLSFFQLPNEQRFYYLLGTHNIELKKLQEFISLKLEGKKVRLRQKKDERERIEDKKSFEALLKKKWGLNTDMLVIGEDMNLSDYRFAECCQPVRGDEVLGFFTANEGISIHRTNCPQAIALMSNFGGNIIKTRWTNLHDLTFLAAIKITGEDRMGIMNDLIKVISIIMKVNMRSITIDSKDGMFEGVFKVFIKDSKQIEELSQKIKKVRGVFKVNRVQTHY